MNSQNKFINIRYLIALIILLMALPVFMPMCARMEYESTYSIRKEALQIWRNGVDSYEQNSNKLPENLYDVFLYLRKVEQIERIPIQQYSKLSEHELERLESDQKEFERLIAFELITSNNTWHIKEKKEGPFGVIFSINNNGEIVKQKTRK